MTVHDGLTLAVGKVTLKPGRSMRSPCMCNPLRTLRKSSLSADSAYRRLVGVSS
ncbi:MAG: hypothetical protein ACLSUZ_01770 [Bifidobacterium pseudocatenulatum]